MAYDEELAERVRAVLAQESGLTEQPMFGSLTFMLGGNMAVAVGQEESGEASLLVRVNRDRFDDLEQRDHVEAMHMGSRVSKTFLRVGPQALVDDDALKEWVGYGADVARSLPAK